MFEAERTKWASSYELDAYIKTPICGWDPEVGLKVLLSPHSKFAT